jgi:hypothetical protein
MWIPSIAYTNMYTCDTALDTLYGLVLEPGKYPAGRGAVRGSQLGSHIGIVRIDRIRLQPGVRLRAWTEY